MDADKLADDMKARKAFFGRRSDPQCIIEDAPTIVPAEIVPTIPDPLPIRGVEYVPTEVDVKTGTVTYELRERSEHV